MSNSKMKRLYTSIITSILLILAMFSGTSYAADISERYSFDSSIADEAFEYGTIYDAKTFPDQVYNEINKGYDNELKNLEKKYNNEETLKAILLKQIRESEPTYSSDNLDEIKAHWLDVKKAFAQNHLTVLETLNTNNTGSYAWNNDFYNNWHLLCLAWGKSIESATVKFNKVDYQYATPSMAFIMNTQADGKGLKNSTLYDYLTQGNKKVDLNKMETSKWGLIGQYYATYQQFSMWMQQKGTAGNFDDGKIDSRNTSFLNQYALAQQGDTLPANAIFGGMTSPDGIAVGYKLNPTDITEGNASGFVLNVWRDDFNPGEDVIFIDKVEDCGISGINSDNFTLNYTVKDSNGNIIINEKNADKFVVGHQGTNGEWYKSSTVSDGDIVIFTCKASTLGNEAGAIFNTSYSYESKLMYKDGAVIDNTNTNANGVQTDLNKVANAYETFIRSIAKLDNGQFKYVEITKDVDGKTEKFMFPELDPDKISGISENALGNAVVSFDKEHDNFVINGLTMGNAVSSSVTLKHEDGSEDTYDFAKVEDIQITAKFSDGTIRTLTQGEDWQYVYNDYAQGTNVAPPAGEKFSIIVKRQDDMTEIVKINYKYKYLIAAANYYYYSDGITSNGTAAQEQAMIDNTARWYIESDQNIELKSYIEITKVVKDAKGNELSAEEISKLAGKDLYAIFKVTVGDTEREVKVKAGTTERIGPFANGLTYKVEEIDNNNDWNIEKIENATGTLEKDQSVRVIATNILKEHSGELQIIKDVDVAPEEDKTFTFNVNIDYKNGKIETRTVSVTVKAGNKTSSTWTKEGSHWLEEGTKVDGIKWYGDNVPSYTVTEAPDSEYTLEHIYNDAGTLKENQTVTIRAINKNTKKPVKLTLEKQIKDGIECDETFKFLVTIENAKESADWNEKEIELTAGNKKEFIFHPASTELVRYTITEKTSEKANFVSFTVSDENNNIINTSTEDIITGDLIENQNVKVKAINEVNEQEGQLRIYKTVEGGLGENIEKQEVYFKVDVTVPEGATLENNTDEFTTEDGIHYTAYPVIEVNKETSTGEWTQDSKFVWKGDIAPTYTIEETQVLEYYKDGTFKDVTSEYVADIKPSSGSLTEFTDSDVKIEVTNRKAEHGGTLTIEKKLYGNQKSDKEFEFEVDVKGISEDPEEIVTIPLTLKAGQSETLSFIWGEDEEAPTYEVREIVPANADYRLNSITADDLDATIDNENKVVSGTIKENTNIKVTAENELQQKNKIQITKTIEGGVADGDEEFTFDVIITKADGTTETEKASIKVKKGEITGEAWLSKEYTWYESDGDVTYKIDNEKAFSNGEDITAKYNPQGLPKEGKLDGSKAVINVDIVNYVRENSGSLTIKKQLSENSINVENEFEFKVTISGQDGIKLIGANDGNNIVETIKIAPNKEWTENFSWEYTGENTDIKPTYKVEEINIPDGTTVTYENQEGTLDGNVIVTATNHIEGNKGKIEVIKDFTSDKRIQSEDSKDWAAKNDLVFTALITVKAADGSTMVYDGEICTEKNIELKLSSSTNWKGITKDISWTGNNAPTFTIQEINIPAQFDYVETTMDSQTVTNNSLNGTLVKGETKSATIKNEPREAIILTMELGGMVWEDIPVSEDDKNISYLSEPNDIYDGVNDKAKANIEVNLYKRIYDNNGNYINQVFVGTTRTETDGRWRISNVGVPAVTGKDITELELQGNGYKAEYNIEFVYDGQTYTSAEALKYGIYNNNVLTGVEQGNVNDFKSNKDRYNRSSMATEVSSESEKIKEIKGNSVMSDDGTTVGTVVLEDGTEQTIMYKKAKNGYPVESTLQTTYGDNEYVYDVFKATATTEATGLSYPLDEHMSLSQGNANMQYSKPLETNNNSDALKVTVTSDGKYVVKEKGGEYYLTSTEGNYIVDNAGNIIVSKGNSKEVKVSRISDDTYQVDIDSNFIIAETYKAIYNYCKNINLGLVKKPDMDLALTKNLTNVTAIVKEKSYKFPYSKYYDFTEEKTDKLRQNITVDGVNEAIEPLQVGLYKSDYNYRAEIYNNDGKVYDALTTLYRKSGKTIEDSEMDVYLTYEIKVQNTSTDYTAVINSIDDYYDQTLTLVKVNETKVGVEQPVATASEYADKWTDVEKGIKGSDGITYNKMTASDLGIELEKGKAATIKMTFKVNKDLYNANSIILGQKANVAEISSYKVSGGKIDRDSAPGNLNIREHNDKSWYEDDTFAAPFADVKLVSDEDDRTISGTVWEDDRTEQDEKGYQYGNGIKDAGLLKEDEEAIPGMTTELVEKVMIPNDDGTYLAYDFIVDKTLSSVEGNYSFTNVPVGDYVVRFTYGDKEIESQDYSTAKYYNGQDYKSSIYKLNDRDTETLLKLDNYNNKADKHQNIAVDNEVRRLQVIEKSREITNENGKVLAAGYNEDYARFRNKLFEDYYMYADTPIIRFNDLNTANKYNLKNIDFALEERPLTELTLDKQIKEILIKTSDGRTLMDAVYNIEYNNEGKATVALDTTKSIGTDNLQALDRNTSDNGFRYINVDSELLQGATITVKYQFTAINNGEVDYTGALNDISFNFNDACEDLSTKLATFNSNKNNTTARGEYLGSHYYYGTGKDDVVVTSTVKELVDYLDNDVEFSSLLNKDANTAWKSSSEDKLVGLVQNTETIKDKNNVAYSKNGNLITSINSDLNSITTVALTPGKTATIELTVSKVISADSDDLQIDNIAEIIRYTNTVGRRNNLAVTGNVKPAEMKVTEPDESITETITLSPPTGSSIMIWRLQVAGAIALSMTIVAGGIILIKKKVLK